MKGDTKEFKAKTAVAYLRVSTKEQAQKGGQAEGFSLPAQRAALYRKAEGLGATIVEEFMDAGESAKSADRPDLQRMLRYLAEHPTDYVLVHKVDRLARNRVDDVEITMAIKKAGATLVSASENIDETPSGMLLHGIMSSIAEFYSRNLATEVHKGMSQKAKTGGTPGRAPLGYRNVGRFSSDGREERTVEVDTERGPLISWAFEAFATGDWTLRSLADELETQGLTTRQTPTQPSRPVRPNVLNSMLTNPYYKGEVTYRGVAHRGNHEPLTDVVTWQRVQDVLTAHAAGEKRREHPHYLKSTVFCGGCESRLIITNSKNRYGAVYPYFVCLGRHKKMTSCRRKAILISTVEQLVEDFWTTHRLDTAVRTQLEAGVNASLRAASSAAAAEHKQLQAAKNSLRAKQKKLVEAIYSGALSMDVVAAEQKRLAAQLAKVEERLGSTCTRLETIESTLTRVLDLAERGYVEYLAAPPLLRRLLNQAVFTHLFIDDRGVRAELARPFDVVLGPEVLGASVEELEPELERTSPTAVLLKTSRGSDGGSDSEAKESAFVFGGLKADTLAALRDSLSNPNPPLVRVLEILDKHPRAGKHRAKYNTAKHVVAQTGATDASTVRLTIKENHKLSLAEVDQLVQANQSGMTQRALAKMFSINLETVNRHLHRRRRALVVGRAAISFRRTDPQNYRATVGEGGNAT